MVGNSNKSSRDEEANRIDWHEKRFNALLEEREVTRSDGIGGRSAILVDSDVTTTVEVQGVSKICTSIEEMLDNWSKRQADRLERNIEKERLRIQRKKEKEQAERRLQQSINELKKSMRDFVEGYIRRDEVDTITLDQNEKQLG